MSEVKGVTLNCNTRNYDCVEVNMVTSKNGDVKYHIEFEYGDQSGYYDFNVEQMRNLRDFLNEVLDK